MRRGAACCRPECSGRLGREELCDRRTNLAVWLQCDPDKAIRAISLGAFCQIVNVGTSNPATTGNADRTNAPTTGSSFIEHLEPGARRERRTKINQLHREANVWLVGAVALHRLVIGECWEWQLLNWAIRPNALRHLNHHRFDIGAHTRLVHEAHLNVELGELRLAVTAEILVSEAARNLEVAVEARDHEELLHLLR